MTLFGWIGAALGRRSRVAACVAAGALIGVLRLVLPGWRGRAVMDLVMVAIALAVIFVLRRQMPLGRLRGRPGDSPESQRRFLEENWSSVGEYARRNGVPAERIEEMRAQVFGSDASGESGRAAE